MGELLKFPGPKKDIKAATCGCGGQQFILVCDANQAPEFVYCVNCQHRQARVKWEWTEDVEQP